MATQLQIGKKTLADKVLKAVADFETQFPMFTVIAFDIQLLKAENNEEAVKTAERK
jgi:hypothetical protein